jgi:nucleotide-binding universal stress UspA family protein
MTVLVGYTASKQSKAALAEALRIARLTGEHLLVVNAGPGGEHRHEAMVTEQQQVELQSVLDGSGLSAEFRQYARGRSTVDEIRDLADEVQPSVVVIGMRRRGGFGRFVMGSVSDGLLKDLNQPVLCVKDNPAQFSGVFLEAPPEDTTAETEPTGLTDPARSAELGTDAGPEDVVPGLGPGPRRG